MEKILTILILIGFNCFSQLDTTFNKYDSLLMNEINILRKSSNFNINFDLILKEITKI